MFPAGSAGFNRIYKVREGEHMKTYEQDAARFVEAIKALASNDTALENLECYLSHHFAVWLEKFANTPQGISEEMKEFSTIH